MNNDFDMTSAGKSSIDTNQPVLLDESSSANMISLIDSLQTQSSSVENNTTATPYGTNDINPRFDLIDSDPLVSSGSLLDQISRDSSTGEARHQHLPAELAGYPSAKTFEQLCSDDTMRVTLCKALKPQELALVFFLYNKHATQKMTEVKVTANLPSSLKVRDYRD